MSKSDSVRAGRILDAGMHLLDRQMLDRDEVPVTAVADLELEGVPRGEDLPEGGEGPLITNLLSGPVLGTRIFGGRPPDSRWERIPWHDVVEIGTALVLSRSADDYEATWTERWARDHIIGRIPGGHHDPE